ncbi:MAG: iron ABC transporter permease [Rhodobacteraceae bacterium]|nr:iron ABC transporter permease [Paracoccaceae bacterium]
MTPQATIVSGFGGQVTLLLHMRALWVASLMLALLLGITAVALTSGTFPLSLIGVWEVLTGNPPTKTAGIVVWEFRLPRAIVSSFAGALFGLSGAILQNVTRNPLADPSLVGISQGASLAVVSLVVAFPEVSQFYRPVTAFFGSLAVAALIQWIAMQRSDGATMRFILVGIGIAAFISSITKAMLTYGDIEQAQEALGWLAGSIHAAGWDEVWSLTVVFVAMVPLLFWAIRPMSALRMGEDVAVGLGVKVRRTRIILITLSVAFAAFGVAAVGPLGFVGLIAPHLSRRLAHSGIGQHLLLTSLVGAVMVALADLAGRVVFAPIQIPAGIVTAILGVPVFLTLIVKSQYNRQL